MSPARRTSAKAKSESGAEAAPPSPPPAPAQNAEEQPVAETRFTVEEQDGCLVIVDNATPQVVVENADTEDAEVKDGPPLVVERYPAVEGWQDAALERATALNAQ